MRAYLEEAPQAVKVFKLVARKITEIHEEKLRTLNEPIDIYRAQGTVQSIKRAIKDIDQIKGN